MKLFQYYAADALRCGAVTSDGAVALADDVSMLDLLGLDTSDLAAFVAARSAEMLDLAQISFAPVVSRPEKILCIGLNYHDHISETGLANDAKPGFPPVFCKFANALVGHGQMLVLPNSAMQFDYEVELVIVIGRDCKDVPVSAATEYIAGFTVGNDFSARDLQFVTSQWTLGKACDNFAPVGPFIVTKEAVDLTDACLEARVNGKVVQTGSTKQMIYTPAEIVSYLSRFVTLKKGDLIFTGTPSGVILGKDKQEQVWLKAGDEVSVEIAGIGCLTNILANA